jgi:hypothetical protein
MELKHEVVEVTPDLARELLTRNTHNRPASTFKIDEYAKAMLAGEWKFNGDSIRISDTGVLLDGQTRLAAIIKANTPQKMGLWWGIEADAQNVMDTGRKRTFANALSLEGESYPTAVAALTNLLMAWEKGARGSYLTGNTMSLQIPEQLRYFHEHKHEIRHAVRAVAGKQVYSVQPRVLALAYTLFARIEPEDAMFFLDRLISGASLEVTHPVLVLRTRLASERAKAESGAAVHPSYILALIIKSWNFYRQGQSISRLQYKPGGATPDTFPEPI